MPSPTCCVLSHKPRLNLKTKLQLYSVPRNSTNLLLCTVPHPATERVTVHFFSSVKPSTGNNSAASKDRFPSLAMSPRKCKLSKSMLRTLKMLAGLPLRNKKNKKSGGRPCMVHNVCVYAVRGIGGLKNEAQRNVKPDHLCTVPRYRTKLRNYF